MITAIADGTTLYASGGHNKHGDFFALFFCTREVDKSRPLGYLESVPSWIVVCSYSSHEPVRLFFILVSACMDGIS